MAYTIQGARSADDRELGGLELPLPGAPEPLSGYMRQTVTPPSRRRCPPGMVATSRGCIRPKKGARPGNPITRALGALGLGADCGCGCAGTGKCAGAMGDLSSGASFGIKAGLVGLTAFLVYRSIKKG